MRFSFFCGAEISLGINFFKYNMTELLDRGFSENRHAFHQSLNRIIDKYSRLSDLDAGIDLDLGYENLSDGSLEKYLKKSKQLLKKLESQSSTSLREESMTATRETTRHSELDVTHQDEDDDQSVSSVGLLSVNENGDSGLDLTRLTMSSVDESRGRLSQVDPQPEDHDEDLQTTLSSNDNSLWELYPDMMGRVKTAVHKQNVCRAAGGVLRRYHRLRKKPKRGSLNNTVVLPHGSERGRGGGEERPEENGGSPARERLTRTERSPRMPLGEIQSTPARELSSPRRSRHKPILAMSVDCSFLNREPKEVQLNQTFIVMRRSPSRQPSSSSGRPTATTPVRPLRPLGALSSPERRGGRSVHAPETTADERSRFDLMKRSLSVGRIEGLHVRCSPQRPSPNPQRHSVFLDSAGLRRSVSPAPGSSSQSRPLAVRPTAFSQTSRPSSEPRPRSRQTPAARHLSFGSSSLQPLPRLLSAQQLDQEYKKVFHQLMCQHKWSGSPAPPRSPCVCGRSFEVRRGDSSSILSALALSPHASNQRKRLRERDGGGHRESKSVRREGWALSERPSLNVEMLRRRLCPDEGEAPRRNPPSTPTSWKYRGISSLQSRSHPHPVKPPLWTSAAAASALESDEEE